MIKIKVHFYYIKIDSSMFFGDFIQIYKYQKFEKTFKVPR